MLRRLLEFFRPPPLPEVNLPSAPGGRGGGEVRTIGPDEGRRLMQQGLAVLVDVRDPAEWGGGVLRGARRLSYADLLAGDDCWRQFLGETDPETLLILLCRGGHRAGQAAALLAHHGYHAANGGGIGEWRRAGFEWHQII